MNSTKFLALGAIFLLMQGCASLRQQAATYFLSDKEVAGVEKPEEVMARMEKHRRLQEIAQGEHTAQRAFECTLLRNQLYVAALHSASKEVSAAALDLEKAYQQDDQTFLLTCNRVRDTFVGQSFMTVQQEYLLRQKNAE
jgi:hypothetical protein